MLFFGKKKKEKPRSRTIRRIMIGFIIGGAVSSIVGKKILKERRREHFGPDDERVE